jgi:catechol 2,3-dioxygenase-like lactoylglutathione lyase family enzyme
MLSTRRTHTTLPVSDLDRARAFYEGTLGFVPMRVQSSAVMYRAGEGSVFALSRSSGKPSGTHTQMGITVDDIDSVVADLKKRGVVFEEYDTPGLKTVDSIGMAGPNRAAWFFDPEGNLIGIVQFAPEE